MQWVLFDKMFQLIAILWTCQIKLINSNYFLLPSEYDKSLVFNSKVLFSGNILETSQELWVSRLSHLFRLCCLFCLSCMSCLVKSCLFWCSFVLIRFCEESMSGSLLVFRQPPREVRGWTQASWRLFDLRKPSNLLTQERLRLYYLKTINKWKMCWEVKSHITELCNYILQRGYVVRKLCIERLGQLYIRLNEVCAIS